MSKYSEFFKIHYRKQKYSAQPVFFCGYNVHDSNILKRIAVDTVVDFSAVNRI